MKTNINIILDGEKTIKDLIKMALEEIIKYLRLRNRELRKECDCAAKEREE